MWMRPKSWRPAIILCLSRHCFFSKGESRLTKSLGPCPKISCWRGLTRICKEWIFMLIYMCKSKIAHGHITEAELFYEGSITIDEDLLQAVNIFPGERVEVLNINNGNRFTTYTIAGKATAGQISL